MEKHFLLCLCIFLKVNVSKQKAASSFAMNMMSVAKQMRDEEALKRRMSQDHVIKSMRPNGDCAYELMCRWKTIHALKASGHFLSREKLHEEVSDAEVALMRQAIAGEQQQHVLEKGNACLKTLISQSMTDWYQNPLQNNGANEEVWTAVQNRPEGVTETEWLSSPEALELHSSLIKNGQNVVFAESPEFEAFSLMTGVPVAIYLPGHCELYPQSTYCRSDADYLVGICNGNHYFLAVPKTWLEEHQGEVVGKLSFFPFEHMRI